MSTPPAPPLLPLILPLTTPGGLLTTPTWLPLPALPESPLPAAKTPPLTMPSTGVAEANLAPYSSGDAALPAAWEWSLELGLWKCCGVRTPHECIMLAQLLT